MSTGAFTETSQRADLPSREGSNLPHFSWFAYPMVEKFVPMEVLLALEGYSFTGQGSLECSNSGFAIVPDKIFALQQYWSKILKTKELIKVFRCCLGYFLLWDAVQSGQTTGRQAHPSRLIAFAAVRHGSQPRRVGLNQ